MISINACPNSRARQRPCQVTVCVFLILPNEQIKFVSVTCPDDADPITINEHIQRKMDGRPYSVDKLRFDHHLADGTLHVAAVHWKP